MKLSSSLYIIAITIITGGILTACDEDDDFERYTPDEVVLADSTLSYNDILSYPVLDVIASDTPSITYQGAYTFVLDSVSEISGTAFQNNRFGIDRVSGVVSYDNDGELAPGTYVLDVGISTVNGLAVFEQALTMEILDVPISLGIDNATVNAGALQVGTIASISYTDESGGDITNVSYAFAEPADGFEINPTTGEVSKTSTVSSPSITFSIRTTTNLGIKTFENVLTVNVGEAPTLKYFQADESTDLTKVTLSPWTAYTTSVPSLEGMEAGGGFEAILPDTLQPFASAFSFDAAGSMSIEEGAGLAEGDYYIGVSATNSGGVSASFDSLFVLTVRAEWETENFISDDFDDVENHAQDPEVAYPGLWANYTFAGSNGGSWKKVVEVAAGSFSGFRRLNPYEIDAGLVRTIDLTDVFALRISFAEMAGYGGAFIDNYYRALYAGDDVTNAMAGSFEATDWNPILDIDGAWQGINWNGGNGPVNVYNNIVIDLNEVSGNTLYLMWRLFPTETSSQAQNAAWIIDYLTAQKAAVYPAIEE